MAIDAIVIAAGSPSVKSMAKIDSFIGEMYLDDLEPHQIGTTSIFPQNAISVAD